MRPSYISSKVRVKESKIGKGIFAIEKILKGETITDSTGGPVRYLSGKEASVYPAELKRYLFQTDEDQYCDAGDIEDREEADFMNHSCDPNCGIQGALRIVAMRDIEPGEEITFDYAMNESAYAFTLKCECGAQDCRRTVTGLDWYQRKLQKKYDGFFSDYIQKKIRRNFFRLKLVEFYERILRMIKLHILNREEIIKIRQRIRSLLGAR